MPDIFIPPPIRDERYMIFGVGDIASLWIIPQIDSKNGEIEFEFVPSEWMKYKWQHLILNDPYYVQHGRLRKKYKEEYCRQIDPNPASQKWWIFCDFAGNPSDVLDSINKDLLIKYQQRKKECQRLRIEIARIRYDFNKTLGHHEEIDKKQLSRMKEMKKIVGSEMGAYPQQYLPEASEAVE